MIKKIALIFVVVFVSLLLIAGIGLWYIVKQQEKLKQGELILEKTVVTIPFDYSTSGHIIINVSVEGSKEAYPFILDSGASNFIFKNHSDEFDLKNNGSSIGLGATGNFFMAKVKKVDKIQIGEVKFKGLNFKEIDFGFNCSDHIYGLIGNGTMRHLNWQIDFEQKEITVSKNLKDLKFAENAIEIPLRINKTSSHPYAYLKFSGRKKSKKFIVDLGNSGTMSVKEKDILKDSLQIKRRKVYGKMSEGLGGESKKKDDESIILLDTVLFNNTTYKVQKLQAKSSSNGMNLLGLGFFKKYKTTISWSDKKMILEPYDSIQNFIQKSRGFGMKYKKEEDKLIIKSIVEKSAASKLELPLNAEVITLNGKDMLSENDFCTYRNLKSTPDTLKIKFKHNSNVKEIAIPKEDLFK